MKEGAKGKITIGLSSAAVGVILTFLGQIYSTNTPRSTTTLPPPLETVVEMKKSFVDKADFNEFIRQYKEDIRRIENRVAEDLRDAAAIRQSISGQIGEIRGEIRQMSMILAAIRNDSISSRP
ncbi:MAG: hypothetical protein FWH21_00580 [Kiritimatiellaeota bacterium]|nr:hypothetical protein [Kiritimatiellota bacterium]